MEEGEVTATGWWEPDAAPYLLWGPGLVVESLINTRRKGGRGSGLGRKGASLSRFLKRKRK